MANFFSNLSAEWVRWLISAGIFAGFVLLGLASKWILTFVVGRFTRHTKTILDDLIVQSLIAPVFAFLVAGGLWIALARLPELAKHVDILHKLFTIIFIGIGAVAVVRVVHAILHWYGTEVATKTESDFDDRLIPILQRVADIVIYVIALMVILDQLKVNISPILAGLGIGGLAVALALQSTLSNFLAGTYVMTDAVIRKGHYIMMDTGVEGSVVEIGWRTTKIRTWQGNLVILPNSRLAEAVVTDYEKPEASMIFSIECGVSYDSDLEKVERVVLEVAKKLTTTHQLSVKDFEPSLRFNKFDDSNINFTVVLKGIDRGAQFTLKHEFIKALHARFQQEGIQIDYPVRRLLFGNGIPQSQR